MPPSNVCDSDTMGDSETYVRHEIGQLINPCDTLEIEYADGIQAELGSQEAIYQQSNLAR